MRPGVVKVLTVRTKLLSGSSFDSAVIAVADAGTPLLILTLEDDASWYWVRAHNREGWVPAAVLESNSTAARESSEQMGFAESRSEGHYLASLQRYYYFENEYYVGTTTLRYASNHALLQSYQAWNYLGAGYGGRLLTLSDHGLLIADGGLRLVREYLGPHGASFGSWQMVAKLRWLEPEDAEFFTGVALGVGYHFSGWPSDTKPLISSPNSLRWSLGFNVGGHLGVQRLLWVLEPAIEFGTYSGGLINFRVLWPR